MQSMPVISYCSQTSRDLSAAIVIFILLAISAPLLASDDQLIITPCNHCETEQDFAMAATRAAPEPPPGDAKYRIYSVYVVNILESEVKYFSVTASRDEGGNQPMTGTYQTRVKKVAQPGQGEHDVIKGLELGAQIALSFKAEFSGESTVDWAEVDSPIASAIQLVGPEGTMAQQHRAQFDNDLNGHLSDFIGNRTSSTTPVVRDIAQNAVASFIGDSSMVTFIGELAVTFEDETWIRVGIESIKTNFFVGGPIGFDFDTKTNTAKLPNGRIVPQVGSAFGDFSYSEGSRGGPSVAESLRELALMYGVQVGDGRQCNFSCEPGTNYCELNCRRR